MKKILIIEDNPEVRENTEEIIGLANYTVITAANGKEGVELALSEKPDLIICDIMMPVLDGYGVYHLLSKHEQTALTPFIFLSAKSEKRDIRKGMGLGAEDYITKPFDSIELLNAIETRLKKSDLLRQQYATAGGADNFLKDVQNSEQVNLISEDRDVFNYSPKQFVYNEGQRSRGVYYLVSGKVKIYRTNEDGKELITNIHSVGEYFGYTAILEQTNHKDNAQVLEEAKLMLIPKEAFLQLISTDKRIAQRFLSIITQNMEVKNENLLNLAYNSLRKKVAFGLMQLLDKYRVEDHMLTYLNLSRMNMAKTIGIATESLIRTLSDFKDEKLIKIQKGKVIIIEEKKLREFPN